MSLKSKVFLVTCLATSVGVITYVHYKQQSDRDQLHMGVVRDIERQRRKAENTYLLQEQIKLTRELQKRNQNNVDI